VDSKVFISHSKKDKAIADAICEHLESAGARCWIAPRDIEAGTEWTEGIMRGIASAGPLQPHLTVLSELVKRLLEGREHGASLSEIGQKMNSSEAIQRVGKRDTGSLRPGWPVLRPLLLRRSGSSW
jgi:TIR domain